MALLAHIVTKLLAKGLVVAIQRRLHVRIGSVVGGVIQNIAPVAIAEPLEPVALDGGEDHGVLRTLEQSPDNVREGSILGYSLIKRTVTLRDGEVILRVADITADAVRMS